MASECVVLSRAELHRLVWEAPLKRLAARFGISDVALGKICRKYAIPTPGRGYWAKVAAGYSLRKTPLPKAPENIGDAVWGHGASRGEDAHSEPQSEVEAREAFERLAENLITVPDSVVRYHPIIRAARKAFGGKSRRKDHTGFLIDVSGGQFRRACLVAETLLRALETRGWTVSAPKSAQTCRAELFGESLELTIVEKKERREKRRSNRETAGSREVYIPFFERYETVALGQLTLGADVGAYRRVATVSDTRTMNLNDRLNEFVAKMTRLAWNKHLATLEAEERRRQWAIEAARREAQQRKAAFAQRRVDSLKLEAEQHVQAENIRAYVRAVRQRSANQIEAKELAEWLAWASAYADRLDPSVNGFVDVKEVAGPDHNPYGMQPNYLYRVR